VNDDLTALERAFQLVRSGRAKSIDAPPGRRAQKAAAGANPGSAPGPRCEVNAMPNPPTKQSRHSWAVYHLKGTPAQFIGIVYDRPDEQTAIERAIEEFKVLAH
jgi:hypothetical protein